jgi:mono/diheme cytochrome c family protein
VKLLLTTPADDVVHSFYVPDFRVKEDCVPGYTNHMWIEADKVGAYNIFCAEFCGRDHAQMITLLHALEREDYEKWLDDRIADRYLPVTVPEALDGASEPITKADAATRYKVYCASCHGPEGLGGLVEGARNFHSLEGWKNGAKISDIFKTLTEGLDGTQMRSFVNLPPWERLALAHYVRGFLGDQAPETTAADIEAMIKAYTLDEQPVVTRAFPIEEAMRARAEDAAKDPKGPR